MQFPGSNAREPCLHVHGADLLYALSASIEPSGRTEVQQLDVQVEERFVVDIGRARATELFALAATVVALPPTRPTNHERLRPGDELEGARLCLVDHSGRREAVVDVDVDVRRVAEEILRAVKTAIAGATPRHRGGPAMRFPHDEIDLAIR